MRTVSGGGEVCSGPSHFNLTAEAPRAGEDLHHLGVSGVNAGRSYRERRMQQGSLARQPLSRLHPCAARATARVGAASIYSELFLAPSSEEPDSQLMTGTSAACLPPVELTRQEQLCRLKVAASENALPVQGRVQCWSGRPWGLGGAPCFLRMYPWPEGLQWLAQS